MWEPDTIQPEAGSSLCWGGRGSLLRDGADGGGLPAPRGSFFDKSKEEGSTEGCKYREIRKSHLAQEIPRAENSWRLGEGSREVSHMLAVIFLIPAHRWVAGKDGGDITAVLLPPAPRLICSERCVPAMV